MLYAGAMLSAEVESGKPKRAEDLVMDKFRLKNFGSFDLIHVVLRIKK
jgi:hypothetical protein